ncbi:MAG: hypothetical protein ACLFMM_08955, partial [Methanohalobium sp.]|uniref:hypothetical protein n=1 Tax=Methanohalobium sp. TaxID=2837493 RepID=UPI00397CA049
GVAINLKLLKLKDVVAVFKLKPQFNRTETSFTPHLKLKDVVAVFKLKPQFNRTETSFTPT